MPEKSTSKKPEMQQMGYLGIYSDGGMAGALDIGDKGMDVKEDMVKGYTEGGDYGHESGRGTYLVRRK